MVQSVKSSKKESLKGCSMLRGDNEAKQGRIKLGTQTMHPFETPSEECNDEAKGIIRNLSKRIAEYLIKAEPIKI